MSNRVIERESFMGSNKAPIIKPGTRYGHLVPTGVFIPGYKDGNKWKKGRVECLCDCGSISYKALSNLKAGHTNCCAHKCFFTYNKTHGHSKDENGKSRKEYIAWLGMKRRCEDNPESRYYKDYYGRGIRMCPEFNDVAFFIEYIGKAPTPQHSLDRIDNNKGYEIGNVRWSTSMEQTNNRRKIITNHTYDLLKQEIAYLKQLLRDNNIQYKAA